MDQLKKQNIRACRLDIKARITEINPPDSSNFMYECETQANFEDILNGKYSIICAIPKLDWILAVARSFFQMKNSETGLWVSSLTSVTS